MATGMDTLARAAGMSSRTLYKHAGSKTELIVAVLDERDRRFFEQIDRLEVSALFDALARWHAGSRARARAAACSCARSARLAARSPTSPRRCCAIRKSCGNG